MKILPILIAITCIFLSSLLFSQGDKSLYIGGTLRASYQINKAISTTPWNPTPAVQSSISILPEIGLASDDLNNFFGFGLGISVSRNVGEIQNSSFVGGVGGVNYRRTLSNNRFISPYAGLGLNISLGQNKSGATSSDFFAARLGGSIGLMHFTEKSWIFLMGVSIVSIDYERFTSYQVFRAGIHNAGTFSFSVIRTLTNKAANRF